MAVRRSKYLTLNYFEFIKSGTTGERQKDVWSMWEAGACFKHQLYEIFCSAQVFQLIPKRFPQVKKILLKKEELTLEGIQQFSINTEEDWKLERDSHH